MNLFALSGLILGTTIFPLGIFVLLKNWKSRVNQTLALFCFAGALWGFGGYKIATIPETQPELALFWYRQVTYVGITLIPAFLWHFINAFLELKKRAPLYFIYLWAFFFIAFLQTPWADSFFGFSNNTFKFRFSSFYWPSPPGPGVGFPTPLFTFYVLSWFAIIIYCHYELYKAFKKSSGLKRSQIKYIFLSALVGFSGGGTCFLSAFGINLYPILNFTSPLYPLIVAYAILKKELLEIKVILTDFLVGIMGVILLILIFLMPTNTLRTLIGSVFILFCFFGYYLIKAVHQEEKRRQDAERLAQKEAQMREEAERFKNISLKLKERISHVLDLEEVIPRITDTLIEVFKIDKISFALKQPTSAFYQFHKTIGFLEKELAAVIRDTSICYYLGNARKPLSKEELKDIQATLERNEIGLLLPLFQKQMLIGIIFLGEKSLGATYSKEDIDLLEALSYQISISLNNALLYEEIKKNKEALEKFYNLTVGREVRMADLKKKIKELEEKLKEKGGNI